MYEASGNILTNRVTFWTSNGGPSSLLVLTTGPTLYNLVLAAGGEVTVGNSRNESLVRLLESNYTFVCDVGTNLLQALVAPPESRVPRAARDSRGAAQMVSTTSRVGTYNDLLQITSSHMYACWRLI